MASIVVAATVSRPGAVQYGWEERNGGSGKEYGREKGYIGVAVEAMRVPAPGLVAYGWLLSVAFEGCDDSVMVFDPEVEGTPINSDSDRCFRSGFGANVTGSSSPTEDGDGEVWVVRSDNSECPRI